MIVSAVKTLIFEDFRFTIRSHPHDRNEVILKLFKGGEPVPADRQTLKLLRFFAEAHPGEELTKEEIYAAVWGNDPDAGGNVHQQVSRLRTCLGEQKGIPRILVLLPKREGYKFTPQVRVEGDLGRVDGLLEWSDPHFSELLDTIRRHDEDAEDVRITNFSFLTEIQNQGFQKLLRRHVRIRMVFVNPDNMHLLRARYGLRTDETPPEYVQDRIRRQLAVLEQIKERFPQETLEWRLSDAMPSGFLVHTREWSMLGIFPAHGSYAIGPMIEAPSGTSLWQTLYDDWKLRWDNPVQPPRARRKRR